MTIRTRAGKGSELTIAEGDDQVKQPIVAKSALDTVDQTDNRATWDCDGTFTVTLEEAATVLAACETNDFWIIIKNSGSGTITIARSGTDTIDGATSIALLQYQSVKVMIDGAGTSYNVTSATGYAPNLSVTTIYYGGTQLTPDATEINYLNGVAGAIYYQGGTDVAVADGGTGSSTASGARTNLGLGSLATASTIDNSSWSGSDLAVTNGGTGASNAADARTNLGIGTLAVYNDVISSLAALVAGTTVAHYVDPHERTTTSSTYVAINETSFIVLRGGTYRVTFSIKTQNAANATSARVYVDGAAFGTEFSTTSTTYVTTSEDLIFTAGDYVDFMLKNAAGEIASIDLIKIRTSNTFIG